MDQLEKATGSAGTINLGGTTFLLERAKGNDLGQWRAFIRERLKKRAANAFDCIRGDLDKLKPRDRREVLKVATENRIAAESLTSPQAAEVMEGLDATAFMLWLSIRRNHPDVTFEKVLELAGETDLIDLQDKLDAINGVAEKKENPDGEPESNGKITHPTG